MKRKAMFCCDASRDMYEDYYTSQTGNGMPIIVGASNGRLVPDRQRVNVVVALLFLVTTIYLREHGIRARTVMRVSQVRVGSCFPYLLHRPALKVEIGSNIIH